MSWTMELPARALQRRQQYQPVANRLARHLLRTILSERSRFGLSQPGTLPSGQTVAVDFGRVEAPTGDWPTCRRLRRHLLGNFAIRVNRAFGHTAVGVGRLADAAGTSGQLDWAASAGNGIGTALIMTVLRGGKLQSPSASSMSLLLPEITDLLPESQLLRETPLLRSALIGRQCQRVESPELMSADACMNLLGAVCRYEKFGLNRLHFVGDQTECDSLRRLLLSSGFHGYQALANPSPWQLGIAVGPTDACGSVPDLVGDGAKLVTSRLADRGLSPIGDGVEFGVALVVMETLGGWREQRRRQSCWQRSLRLAKAIADAVFVSAVVDSAALAGVSPSPPPRLSNWRRRVANDAGVANDAVAALAEFPSAALASFERYEPTVLVQYFVRLASAAAVLANASPPSGEWADEKMGRLQACQFVLDSCAQLLGAMGQAGWSVR